MNRNFLEASSWKKPIIGMLYLRGGTDEEVFEITKREVDTYYSNGADAVLVGNYSGTYHHMIPALEYLQENYKDHICGVNCLYQNTLIFELAIKYETYLVQIDAIAGNLIERKNISSAEFTKLCRSRYPGYITGSVRPKHTPYLSGKSLEGDLKTVMICCNTIAISQDETGQETSMGKTQEFRGITDDFPLVVGAGLTVENYTKQFAVAGGDIVGSWVKDAHIAIRAVDEKSVRKLIVVRDTLVKRE